MTGHFSSSVTDLLLWMGSLFCCMSQLWSGFSCWTHSLTFQLMLWYTEEWVVPGSVYRCRHRSSPSTFVLTVIGGGRWLLGLSSLVLIDTLMLQTNKLLKPTSFFTHSMIKCHVRFGSPRFRTTGAHYDISWVSLCQLTQGFLPLCAFTWREFDPLDPVSAACCS